MTKCIIHSNIKLCEGGDTVVEKTIKEIRETEQQADDIIAEAKSRSEKLLENARKEAENLESGMIEQAQDAAKKACKAAQNAGKETLEEALRDVGKEIAEIKVAAKSREKEAVDAIIESLV